MMPLFDGFLPDTAFADSVTTCNLLLFVLIREYLSAIDLDDPVYFEPNRADGKVKFYMFCYDLMRGGSTNPFACLRQHLAILPVRLQTLLHSRIHQLRNFFELVNYTHPSVVRGLFFSDVPLEDEDKFMLTKDSVFGLFLRRFSLGFHHQSFEQMTKFLNNFLNAYDGSFLTNSADSNKPNEAFQVDLPAIVNDISESTQPVPSIVAKPNDLKQRSTYPEPSSYHPYTPQYASLLHATQKRNLTQAELDLCGYFETRMAAERSDSGLNNVCAYMAVAAADTHLSFGNRRCAQRLEKEALKKSLESESKAPLSHLKITHRLLNPTSEPLRYDGQLGWHTLHRSAHTAFSELRTIFWDLIDSGAPASRPLLLYFNTPIAMMPNFFSVCLLDVATAWALYGYPVLHTALLQCVINADCLQPCVCSDSLLSIAFANLIKVFGDAGAVKEAMHINAVASKVLCRSPEKMALRQAVLQVELEQALRSRVDLARCDRLVNALRLCCPWEATLLQAEVERCRGNYTSCHDLLRYVAISADAHTKCPTLPDAELSSRLQPTFCLQPFSHLDLATLDSHISVGGLAKIALIGLRARLSLAQLFLSNGMCHEANKELDNARRQAEKFRLSSGEATVLLLRQAANITLAQPQETASLVDHMLSELLHRSDLCTRFRCLVFVSRLRLSHASDEPDRSFLKCHTRLLLSALQIYRHMDDRQQILQTLVLLIAALHTSGQTVERNRTVHALEELRSKHHFPLCSIKELAATFL